MIAIREKTVETAETARVGKNDESDEYLGNLAWV